MSAAMAAGAMASAAGSIGVFAGTLLGDKKPKIPRWDDVSMAEETEKAVKGAEEALPGVQDLFKKVNTFMGSELMRGMETLVPGSTATVARSITDMLQGKLPSDMVKNLASTANARMMGLTGTSRSQFRDYFNVEKLGELGMKYQQTGFQNLLSYGQALMPQLANPVAWLATPFQQAELTMKNREMQWQRNLMANQVDALPSGWSKALVAAGSTLAGVGGQMMSNPQMPSSSMSGGGGSGGNGMTVGDWSQGAGGPNWGAYGG